MTTTPSDTAAPPAGSAAGGAITHLGPGGRAPAELRAVLTPAAAVVAGANIVMQLAQLPVGRGVAESRVDSGNLYLHPFKRARTTFGYVMIALFGTDEEREVMARAVTEVHRRVRSLPGDPVRYHALDPALQLWVAACIYRGFEDGYGVLYGPPSDDLLDLVYAHAARVATMLQVPPEMWPPDRASFETYWADRVAHIEMDDVTRAYLSDFVGLGFLPWPLPPVLGPLHRIVTAGFLPTRFREELRLRWGPREQRIFSWHNRVLRVANHLTPGPLRTFSFDLVLWDMRRLIRSGHRIL